MVDKLFSNGIDHSTVPWIVPGASIGIVGFNTSNSTCTKPYLFSYFSIALNTKSNCVFLACLVLPSVHDNRTPVSFIDKQEFRYTNNTVSDYFHLKTDLLFEETKVVRLWPHLSHRLLRPWLVSVVKVYIYTHAHTHKHKCTCTHIRTCLRLLSCSLLLCSLSAATFFTLSCNNTECIIYKDRTLIQVIKLNGTSIQCIHIYLASYLANLILTT